MNAESILSEVCRNTTQRYVDAMLLRWQPYFHLQQHGKWHADEHGNYFELRPMREKERMYRTSAEPVLETPGGIVGQFTVNSYMAIIANVNCPMVVDIDQQWYGGRPLIEEDEVCDQVEKHCSAARLYGTYAGWRVIITAPTYPAGSGESWELMRTLGADPRYMKLCDEQKCYRARLTPKPWRSDEQYVCCLVKSWGDETGPRDLFVAVHDALTLRPLAEQQNEHFQRHAITF